MTLVRKSAVLPVELPALGFFGVSEETRTPNLTKQATDLKSGASPVAPRSHGPRVHAV